jgi:ribosomal protein S18 acetylase RimI-like enzyme
MLARLFRDLSAFQPTLVGTYPLGLVVAGSDIDIACTCDDLDAFERTVREVLAAIGVATPRVERLPAVVASFALGDLAVEIFGDTRPVLAQAGFRHMVIEGQLLVLGGAALHARVRERKRGGMKTEPAFAQVLGLDGDPYTEMLALEAWSPARLRALVARTARAEIAIHEGDRAALLPLFRLADDSEREIAAYLPLGTVLVASEGTELVGHVQLIEGDPWELKSLAVVEAHRGTGLGRQLVEAGLGHARARGARRVILATGAADTHLLRFYQRLGFRLDRIERDAFTPAAGYPPDLRVDGIPLLDRVWMDIAW